MFKRTPKPRDNPIAGKVLEAMKAQDAAKSAAREAFAAGQAFEAEGEDEKAIEAYLASADAWQRNFVNTGHGVDSAPYLRLGILFRRMKLIDPEVQVLESYMAHAGRDADGRVEERLHRALELQEQAYAEAEEGDDLEHDA